MSKIYAIIESQVNNILRLNMEDENGVVQYGTLIPAPKYIQPFISLLTALIIVILVSIFGLFLWNQGLHATMPNVFAEIATGQPGQAQKPFVQLLITLLALMFIF